VWYTLVLFPWRCDSTDKHNSKPSHQNWTSSPAMHESMQHCLPCSVCQTWSSKQKDKP